MQRVFRCHLCNLGRKGAQKSALEQEWADNAVALNSYAATDIARMWRGYCGRKDASYLRAEMAKFLFAIRQEELADDEEEYLLLTIGCGGGK